MADRSKTKQNRPVFQWSTISWFDFQMPFENRTKRPFQNRTNSTIPKAESLNIQNLIVSGIRTLSFQIPTECYFYFHVFICLEASSLDQKKMTKFWLDSHSPCLCLLLSIFRSCSQISVNLNRSSEHFSWSV